MISFYFYGNIFKNREAPLPQLAFRPTTMYFSLLFLLLIKAPQSKDLYFSSCSIPQLSLQHSQSHFTLKAYNTNVQKIGKDNQRSIVR